MSMHVFCYQEHRVRTERSDVDIDKHAKKASDEDETHFSSAVFASWTRSFVQSPLATRGPADALACADAVATG